MVILLSGLKVVNYLTVRKIYDTVDIFMYIYFRVYGINGLNITHLNSPVMYCNIPYRVATDCTRKSW
jgi:hypothetical protein